MNPGTTPEHSNGMAHFRATFPVRLWVAAVFSACALSWFYSIPSEAESGTAQLPARELQAGNAG